MTNLADTRDVRDRISGSVVEPGDAGYDESRAVYNAMIDRRPIVVARCRTVGDVQAALDAGRRAGVPVAVRGGGHSGPGFGTVGRRRRHRSVPDAGGRRRPAPANGVCAGWRHLGPGRRRHPRARPGHPGSRGLGVERCRAFEHHRRFASERGVGVRQRP
jgi:hypothetical protein